MDPLERKLEDLGYEAFSIMSGIGFDEDGNLQDDEEKFKAVYENPRKFYFSMDSSIIDEIRKIYNELVKKSMNEGFYYVGSDYKTIVKCTLRDKSQYNNKIIGWEDIDYIKLAIKNMKSFLREELIRVEDLTPDFELGCGAYFIFLNYVQQEAIRLNLKKAIKILKQEVKKLELGSEQIVEEEITYDYAIKDSDMAKLSYFNESGILKHLHEKNSPKIIARFLMRFMDFKNKEETIERYIKICLQEPYNNQYPKNSEDVQTFLAKINLKQ